MSIHVEARFYFCSSHLDSCRSADDDTKAEDDVTEAVHDTEAEHDDTKSEHDDLPRMPSFAKYRDLLIKHFLSESDEVASSARGRRSRVVRGLASV